MAVSKENVLVGNHGNPILECCQLPMEAKSLGTYNEYLVLSLLLLCNRPNEQKNTHITC